MALLHKVISTNSSALTTDIRETKKVSLTHTGITVDETMPITDNSAISNIKIRGKIDCSTNPPFPSADRGDYYIISAAGMFGTVSVKENDTALCLIDESPESREAAISANWLIPKTGGLDGYSVSTSVNKVSPSDAILLTEKAIVEYIGTGGGSGTTGNFDCIKVTAYDDFQPITHLTETSTLMRFTIVTGSSTSTNFTVTIQNKRTGESQVIQKFGRNAIYSFDIDEYVSNVNFIVENSVGTDYFLLEYMGSYKPNTNPGGGEDMTPLSSNEIDAIMV